MTIGDVERSRPVYEKFAATITGRNYPLVMAHSKILENTGHSGTKSETYGRGMQYIFEKPKLGLDAALLNKYSGGYQSADGNKVELKTENGRLAIYFSPTFKYLLFSASDTEFYSTSEFFNIRFKLFDGKPAGFELERYGNTQFIKRTN